MKKLILLFAFFAFTNVIFAQGKAEKQVAEAVETLRKAMIDPNKALLESISSPNLTYGHSNGHLENQAEFVEALVTNKSDFHTIDLSNQTITISGKTAIVRHNLTATTSNSGVPGSAHLSVLLIFQKTGKNWLLLARQAVKI
jgi:Domain of unknown function (DUF4440)